MKNTTGIKEELDEAGYAAVAGLPIGTHTAQKVQEYQGAFFVEELGGNESQNEGVISQWH